MNWTILRGVKYWPNSPAKKAGHECLEGAALAIEIGSLFRLVRGEIADDGLQLGIG
jgi:hypothetical protein